MPEDNQWYTNKELFEMVQGLRDEMAQTRQLVREYNGLRQVLDSTARRVAELEQRAIGRASVADGIRVWGGWAVGLAGLALALWRVGA